MRGIDLELAGYVGGIPGTLDRLSQGLPHGVTSLKCVAVAGRAGCHVSLRSIEVN